MNQRKNLKQILTIFNKAQIASYKVAKIITKELSNTPQQRV